MNTITVRNVEIGAGKPKIIVPIVGVTHDEIIAEAKSFKDIALDVVEWRVDWFDHSEDWNAVEALLKDLRDALGDTPILMTFRTSKEGGEKAIEMKDYIDLNVNAAKSGLVDLVDVEVFSGDDVVKTIIEEAHKCGVKVVASNHDFHKTPAKSDIVYRLRKMQDLGADIPKIAVMPNSMKDVLTLLAATEEMANDFADRPIITMSMGPMGVISRLAGQSFGSSMTFGAAKKASAPGQMGVADLDVVLNAINQAM
ncbi:MAG: type I 3-dehydroquinate dehydratase [Allobaculum sp.]